MKPFNFIFISISNYQRTMATWEEPKDISLVRAGVIAFVPSLLMRSNFSAPLKYEYLIWNIKTGPVDCVD